MLELICEGELERMLDGVLEKPFVYVYCAEVSPNWMSLEEMMLRLLTPLTRAVAPIASASKGEMVTAAGAAMGNAVSVLAADKEGRRQGRSMEAFVMAAGSRETGKLWQNVSSDDQKFSVCRGPNLQTQHFYSAMRDNFNSGVV